MRKLILALVLVTTCVGMAFGEENFDFRNVNWNAGINEVRACLETHLSIMKRFNSMLAMAI